MSVTLLAATEALPGYIKDETVGRREPVSVIPTMAFQMNALLLVSVAFLGTLFCQAGAQTLLLGACPTPPIPQNFSAQDFMGRWYEVERTFVMAEVGWRCITVDYREENGRIRVETLGQAINIRRQMTAVATFTPNTPSRIILRGEGSLPTQSTNYVLNTDYKNYAIVWSCRNVEPPIPITGLDFLRNISHTENLWILSRTRSLSPEYKELIYSFLDNNAISRRSLRTVAQDTCQASLAPGGPQK